MRRERRSRRACNIGIDGKKASRCIQEEEHSPGGSTGRSGTRGRKEYLEVLLKCVVVVGHSLIGFALLIELALYIARLL